MFLFVCGKKKRILTIEWLQEEIKKKQRKKMFMDKTNNRMRMKIKKDFCLFGWLRWALDLPRCKRIPELAIFDFSLDFDCFFLIFLVWQLMKCACT